MKLIKRLCLIMVLGLAVGIALGAATKNVNPALTRAAELYCPVACTGPGFGFKQPICTAFPVAEDLLMTAGHCQCNDFYSSGNVLNVSVDGGLSWIFVEVKDSIVVADWDIQLIKVNVKPRTIAQFRNAVFGEEVANFGIPWDTLGSFGYIVSIFPDFLRATNGPVGGLSGSALVGRDGKVVGMTVVGQVDHRFATSLTGAIPAHVLQAIIAQYRNGTLKPAAEIAVDGAPIEQSQPPQPNKGIPLYPPTAIN